MYADISFCSPSRIDVPNGVGCGVETAVNVRRRSGCSTANTHADGTTPVVADEMARRRTERVDEPDRVADERQDPVVVDVRRPGALRVPTLIGRDDAVSRGRQHRDLRPPLVRRLGEPVQQQHEFAVGWAVGERGERVLPHRQVDVLHAYLRPLLRDAVGARGHEPGCAQALRPGFQLRCGSAPLPVVDLADVGVGAQRREVEEQVGGVACRGERCRELRRAARLHVPVGDVVGDLVDVLVPRQHHPCRLRAPAGQAGEAVGGVADEREVVGDRRRAHAELLPHARLVDHPLLAPIELDHHRIHHALPEVLVGRADERPLDSGILTRDTRG